MNIFTDLLRSDLKDLIAYSSARTESEGFVPSIAIDANEFPWPCFTPTAAQCNPNRYPEPQPVGLRERLSALWGVPSESIMIGRGSDEGIDVLMRLFCRAGLDNILICPPTYGMYEVAARIQGAGVISVPLRQSDFQLDLPTILATSTAQTKLIFIPSPNAPMGHPIRHKDILDLCKARATQSLIVIDEAYVEFTDQPQGMISELSSMANLVILRTLSKAYALAGERVGAVIGAPELIRQLRKIIAPYPLTQTSICVALEALSPNGLIHNRERRALLVNERKRMAEILVQSPWVIHIYPSVTNFILIRTTSAIDVMQQLRRFGILARDRSRDLPNAVRLSIGTQAENDLVLQALEIPQVNLSPLSLQRLFSIHRETKETSIDVTVNLDTATFLKIETGIGFFDHMLAQLATHGGFGLALHCQGDLIIDQHHSIEDCALALGEALKEALGDKRGIARFGFTAPLDEALAQVSIDLSGRPYCIFEGILAAPSVGEMNTEMVPHFFQSLANSLRATIHLNLHGDNTHHMVEAAFKATGRALRQAFRCEGQELPSTKGIL